MISVLAFLIAATPVSSSSVAEQLIDALVAGQAELPSLREVQEGAVEALGLASLEEAESWPSRARWRGVVPRVAASVGSDTDLDIRGSWTSPDHLTTTRGRQLGFDVAVRFELGELVFSDQELRASREAIARAAAVQLARDRATQIYFERLELALSMRDAPSPSLVLAVARLDGMLDAITGGRLSRHRKGYAK